jgi:hypothetical protein
MKLIDKRNSISMVPRVMELSSRILEVKSNNYKLAERKHHKYLSSN